jgi:hypothetical protein
LDIGEDEPYNNVEQAVYAAIQESLSLYSICQQMCFSMNEKRLLADTSFRDKIETPQQSFDKKIIFELNKLKSELKETTQMRDNFKLLYDQCLTMKDSKRLELITLLRNHIENLILQIPNPVR